MPSGEIGRATTRLIEAGNAVCEALDVGRQNRERYHD